MQKFSRSDVVALPVFVIKYWYWQYTYSYFLLLGILVGGIEDKIGLLWVEFWPLD